MQEQLGGALRAGSSLQEACGLGQELQEELREACHFLGKELEGPAAVGVGGIGEGSTTGATRKLLARAREEWRFDTFERSLVLQGREAVKGRAISSWKERDKYSKFQGDG